MAKKKLVTQLHHLVYPCPEHGQKEVVGRVFKGEHDILRRLHRRTNISKAFIKDFKMWVALNEDNAKDLDKNEEIT